MTVAQPPDTSHEHGQSQQRKTDSDVLQAHGQ
jgi:hypothetical protein